MSVLSRLVLQLRQSWEPDGVITARHALALLRRPSGPNGKPAAVIVLPDPGHVLRTPEGRVYEVPSIIALARFVDVRTKRKQSKKYRMHIFMRDRYRCQYCGVKFPAFELTLDHITPRSRDGYDEQDNLATACKPCNQRKGNRTPDEARMPLIATPSALRYGLDRAMLAHYAETRPDWKPYLFISTAERAA